MVTDGERKTSLEGIKKRWVYNYIILLTTILLVLEGSFVIFIKSYYYNNTEQDLRSKSKLSSEFFNKFMVNNTDDWENIARQIVQDSAFNESVEIQVVDLEGNIIMSSSGFEVEQQLDSKEFKQALKGTPIIFQGKNKLTNEKIMEAYSPLVQDRNKIVGMLRFVTSFEQIDNVVKILIATSLIIIFIILTAMLLLSLIFSKSIIGPLNEINEVAKKMAKGQYSERIEKRYNDEIGELADTLNSMAGEILETTKLKNDFISSISHELRTPLTSIKGWGETILTGGLDDKYETELGLKIIVKETTRLSQMVEELLDFSRIESGRITLHLEPVDIESVLNDIVHMFKHRGQKDGVIVEYNHPAFIPEIIADQNRLRQVFINTIDNAIKFTESGNKVCVAIDSDEENVCITVKDEGIGINQEDLPKVKEKFFKGTSKKSGSGIGLAVSDEIIKLHGGTFEIESELDLGTRIIIKLPMEK